MLRLQHSTVSKLKSPPSHVTKLPRSLSMVKQTQRRRIFPSSSLATTMQATEKVVRRSWALAGKNVVR